MINDVMKNTTSPLILATLLVLAAVFNTAPTATAQTTQPVPPNDIATAETTSSSATIAVFYTSGVIEAKAEFLSASASAVPVVGNIGFRSMSYINSLVAHLLRLQNSFVPAAYFQGRADAFGQLADLFGEP